MITADSPILAAPRATPEQAIRYILSRWGNNPHYTAYDISNVIVPAYFAQAIPLGVDPVGAIAQAVHEGFPVSFWSSRPRRNPSGIGVTGQWMVDEPAFKDVWQYNPDSGVWEYGLSFATWEHDAIPAHLGRLLAYALPITKATPAQRAAIARALAVRTLPQSYRGIAPTYRLLGSKWAVPGTHYGERIADIINAIVATRI